MSSFRKSGQGDAVDKETQLTGKESSGSKCLDFFAHFFIPVTHFYTYHSFEVNAVHRVCEMRCGGKAFSFDEFL